ncbi:MAG: 2Fe-2S iron-sulfur cluster-binding protein [Pseudomonadota bacterium]|nr:2Fe-2S iron-sulfur cluster-binding protein [Pseudomonadota bacterium]
MPLFYPLKVASIDRTAEDAVCVALSIPDSLKTVFTFRAGQHVSVRRAVAGLTEYRTYSIVSGPDEQTLKLGVRVQPGGRVSTLLGAALVVGDELEVAAPAGRFCTALDPSRTRSYVAFAAGSGITPILSLAKHCLAHELRSRFTLIYGNRSMAHTMFLDETLALKNRYMSRFAVHFVMSREPQQSHFLNGRIDAAKVRELSIRIAAIGASDEYFVCGPGAMVDEVRGALQQLNGEAPILFERFAVRPPAAAKTDAPVTAFSADELLATISVTMDGRVREFPMSPKDASVLEAAERAGLELPFSCRAGICATCRTRITSGAAVMAHNIALEPWEVDAGFVLCCQARPITQALAISYDQK